MKIFDQNNKEIANVALDMNSIQFDSIITDAETVLIPYVNAEFLKAVNYLVYRNARRESQTKRKR